MSRLVFVVPCHGRHAIASACLRQLARTVDELRYSLIAATAVLVSDEPFFSDLASTLGFHHVEQANAPLGRKWNDGYEYACRELDADFLVPFGSDDVVDPVLFGRLPRADEIRCSRLSAVVSPDARLLALLRVPYDGGDGIRILPRQLLERVGCRPVADDRDRAIDGSMGDLLLRETGRRPRWVYHDVHPLQIVDFKSNASDQRNGFNGCRDDFSTAEHTDVFARLRRHYPTVFVEEIAAAYNQTMRVAA